MCCQQRENKEAKINGVAFLFYFFAILSRPGSIARVLLGPFPFARNHDRLNFGARIRREATQLPFVTHESQVNTDLNHNI